MHNFEQNDEQSELGSFVCPDDGISGRELGTDEFFSADILPEATDMPGEHGEETAIAIPAPEVSEPFSVREGITSLKRAAFFEKVGHCSDEAGVNVKRVGHFFAALGFSSTSEHLVYPETAADEVSAAIRDLRLGTGTGPGFRHFFEIDLSIVRRREYPAMTEANLAYCKALSARGVTDAPPEDDFTGHFLEFGFAKWVETEYSQHTRLFDGRLKSTYVPPQYRLYRDPPSKYAYADRANYAAMVWDVLFDARPELLPQTIALRQAEANFAAVAGVINDIEPDLYETLAGVVQTKTAYDAIIGDDALSLVLAVTGKDREDLHQICEHGAGARYVAERLAAFTARTGEKISVPASDMPALDVYNPAHPRYNHRIWSVPVARSELLSPVSKADRHRRVILQELGHLHREGGVNTDRANRFLHALRIHACGDYLIIGKQDWPAFDALRSSLGYGAMKKDYPPGYV